MSISVISEETKLKSAYLNQELVKEHTFLPRSKGTTKSSFAWRIMMFGMTDRILQLKKIIIKLK